MPDFANALSGVSPMVFAVWLKITCGGGSLCRHPIESMIVSAAAVTAKAASPADTAAAFMKNTFRLLPERRASSSS
jgi:hypothetical protein